MGLLPRIRALLSSLLLAALVGLPAAPASAAVCSGSTGVSVVVQFPDNHIETGCAPGDPSSGLAALDGAGFKYAFVPQQPGAVCTINGQPASRDCWSPPNSWSYWYAERGGSWTYSSLGGGNRDPKPGTVEGWVFGTKDKPGLAPPAAVPPATAQPTRQPRPKPSKKPTRKPKPTATVSSVAPSSSPTPTSSRTPTPTTSASATSSASPEAVATGEPSRSPTDGPATTGDLVGAGGPVSAEADSSGGLSWGWGVGLVVVLAVAGGVTAIVRRRA